MAYIDLSKSEESASLKIRVSHLRYAITHGNPTEVALMLLPPQDVKDRDQSKKFMALFKSLTGYDYLYTGDKPKSPHRGIFVKITWRDSNNQIMRQKIVYSDYGSGKVMTRPSKAFPLDGMALPPGEYSVIVETIYGDPRFEDTQTAICSGYVVK